MILATKQAWYNTAIREFFAAIDSFIYKLIGTVYEITIDISNIIYFGDTTNPDHPAIVDVGEFTRKIYLLLGVFMVFKISFSFIKYMLDPESFTDKGKGVQKLIQNIVLVLVMLIAVPWVFDKLYDLQTAILDDKVIERLIFENNNSGSGTVGIADNAFVMSDYCRYDSDICDDPKADDCQYMGQAKSSGDYISLTLFKPFYQYNDALFDEENFVAPAGYCSTDEELTIDDYLSTNVLKEGSGDDGWFSANEEGAYYINYNFLISTITGIVALLFMISIAFDVAVRCLKLGFLQMIAPIPIISYIDPEASKKGMFSKWLEEVGKTWANLFIRLFALYFAVFIISKLGLITTKNADLASKSGGYIIWLNIIFVLGALMFAKQFPSLLESLIPGLKMGKLQLNPFSKIKSEALGGETIAKLPGRAAVAVGAAGLAAYGAFGRNRLAKKNAMEKVDKKDSISNLKNRIDENAANLNKWKQTAAYRNGTSSVVDKVNSEQKRLDRLQQVYNEQRQKAYKEEMNKKFSTRHAGAASAASIARAAASGAQQGAKNPVDALRNIKKVATDVAETTNKNDNPNRSFSGRRADFLTDIMGTTNESGGTGLLEGNIKKLSNEIDGLKRALENTGDSITDSIKRYSPTDKAEFWKNVQPTGPGGAYQYERIPDQFRDMIPLLEQFNKLTADVVEKEKEMKQQQKFINKDKK